MKYIVKIPIYKYNTGRADNGNIILDHWVASKKEGLEIITKLNSIFYHKGELSEQNYDYLQSIIDWQGFMIKECYLAYISEGIV